MGLSYRVVVVLMLHVIIVEDVILFDVSWCVRGIFYLKLLLRGSLAYLYFIGVLGGLLLNFKVQLRIVSLIFRVLRKLPSVLVPFLQLLVDKGIISCAFICRCTVHRFVLANHSKRRFPGHQHLEANGLPSLSFLWVIILAAFLFRRRSNAKIFMELAESILHSDCWFNGFSSKIWFSVSLFFVGTAVIVVGSILAFYNMSHIIIIFFHYKLALLILIIK